MEKYFALIKNNLVDSIILADEDFLVLIKDKYDLIIDVTNNRPNVGDSYYSDINSFIPNDTKITHISVDSNLEHLQQGTEDGFKPFNLSKYTVSYKDGIVTIGCKQYPAQGILDVLHKLLVEKQQTTRCFTILDDGPGHGKFHITWEDAQILYDTLIKVKF